MKKSLKYILLVLLIILLVASITISTLIIKYETKGDFSLVKQYKEIHFNNIIMDKDISIKINEEDTSIHIEIPEFNNEVEFSIDISNIGNQDTILKNFSYTNIVTNLDQNNLLIIPSLKEGDVIKGGEKRRLNVVIKYNGKVPSESYLNFNINYLFSEENL
jgi:plasmid rolling circle replication initiator protein Rep